MSLPVDQCSITILGVLPNVLYLDKNPLFTPYLLCGPNMLCTDCAD